MRSTPCAARSLRPEAACCPLLTVQRQGFTLRCLSLCVHYGIPRAESFPFYGRENEQECAGAFLSVAVSYLFRPGFPLLTSCLLTHILVKICNHPPIS